MEALGLVVGHLLGDFVFQNDWMAANKSNPHPGRKPGYSVTEDPTRPEAFRAAMEARNDRLDVYYQVREDWQKGHAACTLHCLVYTSCVWLCSFWWMPPWGVVVCFLAHWPIDRWRLARWWMTRLGQYEFATGPLSPWSVIVVDNTFHLLTLFLIGAASR